MKSGRKIAFITTIFNESSTIDAFLKSLFNQTKQPDEIIIVDGGSTDGTLKRIKEIRLNNKNFNGRFVLITKKGNRSVGRNEAIKQAKAQVIVCSDAGCVLDKNFIKNITEPFRNKNISVVAGFYEPVTNNVFERCLAAYTSVMPDKVDPENFLPSSRSVAFRKNAWRRVGGYPEELDTCEDLVFARELKRNGLRFSFVKNAFVYWPQRHNLKEAFSQFYSYAIGDGQARYIRPQTPLLFLRYLLGIFLVIFYLMTKSYLVLDSLFLLLLLYLFWAIKKNYRYIDDIHALYLLPSLQFTSDIAVIFGFITGYIKHLSLKKMRLAQPY